MLVLTRPDVISAFTTPTWSWRRHRRTNTFNGTAIAQADYGLESFVYEINGEAARLAKAAATEWTARTPDRPRVVAGAMGPTNKTLSLSPDVNNPACRAVTFTQVKDAYAEQARGLLDGGCDLLMVETIFDTLNAKAAIVAIEEVFDARGSRVPVMISATVADKSGRTLSGQTIEAFWLSIAHARPFSVGLNCALGAREMRPYLVDLEQVATCFVSCYPNAGLPNPFGQYDETPDDTARPSASLPTKAWSTSSAVAVAHARSHLTIVPPSAAFARDQPPFHRRAAAGVSQYAAWSRSPSGPTATSR